MGQILSRLPVKVKIEFKTQLTNRYAISKEKTMKLTTL